MQAVQEGKRVAATHDDRLRRPHGPARIVLAMDRSYPAPESREALGHFLREVIKREAYRGVGHE